MALIILRYITPVGYVVHWANVSNSPTWIKTYAIDATTFLSYWSNIQSSISWVLRFALGGTSSSQCRRVFSSSKCLTIASSYPCQRVLEIVIGIFGVSPCFRCQFWKWDVKGILLWKVAAIRNTLLSPFFPSLLSKKSIEPRAALCKTCDRHGIPSSLPSDN